MRRGSYLATLVLVAPWLLLQGCARTGERQAMRAVRAFEDSVYARPTEQPPAELEPDATLEDCLLHAERQNPGLEAAFHRWKAAVERIPQVRSLPDPRLSYAYFLRSVETRVGPQEHTLTLTQTFPWFGKLAAQGDAAVEVARAAEKRYEALRLRVFHAVIRAYAEHYYLARSIEITGENLELMTHWEEVARARFRAGTGTHAAVVQAQVELGVLTDRLGTLRDRRGAVLAQLNSLLSRSADTALSAPDSLPDETSDATDEELLALLREASPELLALQFEVKRKRRELDLAGKAFYPDFTLGAGYVFTGDAINPELEDSGKDPLTAQVAINVPIWRGRYAAAEREAEALLHAARREHEDRTLALEAGVKGVAFELRDAGRKVRLYRDTLIPKAEQSLQATSTAFEAGRLEFLNVIEAQRVLLEFQLAYQRALSDQLARLAKLEMLVGRRLARVSGAGQ
jgi:outer membrane protein TolC